MQVGRETIRVDSIYMIAKAQRICRRMKPESGTEVIEGTQVSPMIAALFT